VQGDAIRNYYHERHVIQDMLVPSYRVGDALEFSDREFEVWLWITALIVWRNSYHHIITR
jgi:delta24-sterol reductase